MFSHKMLRFVSFRFPVPNIEDELNAMGTSRVSLAKRQSEEDLSEHMVILTITCDGSSAPAKGCISMEKACCKDNVQHK